MVFSVLKFSVLAALCATASAAPFVARQNTPIPTPEQITALAPDLGGFPNTNPNQFGDCDGPRQADGTIPRVPCQCPPTRDRYISSMIADIQAGHAVNNSVVRMTFPIGDSVQDKHGRITAAIITLQNLDGPGKGCPGVSTTLGIQAKNLDKCGDFQCPGDANNSSTSSSSTSTSSSVAPPASSTEAPAATSPPAASIDDATSTVTVTSITVVTSIVTVTRDAQAGAPTPDAAQPSSSEATTTSSSSAAAVEATTTSTTSSSSSSAAAATSSASAVGNGNITRDLVDQLAPDLGSKPNNNPNSAGDCDGPPQPDGSIKRVPCACPPERDAFIDSLFADILAGHAVHNPSVRVSFPTDNSAASRHARITAASIALQNLNGPGQGCPIVSTTFSAQSNAIGN